MVTHGDLIFIVIIIIIIIPNHTKCHLCRGIQGIGKQWAEAFVLRSSKGCNCKCKDLGPVVGKVDNAIHWINLYPVDNAIDFSNTYPLYGDLSGG